MDKLTVRDFDARDKRIFVRVDFNVPLEDGKVTDDSRIRASLPTIVHLLSQGGRVVLASHLGRPDGKVQDGLRLRPVGERLSLLLRRNVPVTGDALGPGTEDAIRRIRPGEALLLENLRFHSEEEANDPTFAATLASYADIYVNDAFGTAHRAHASTVGVAKLLPAYAGLLMEREIGALSKLLESPEHPYAAIVGGAKVSGKLKVLDNLLTKVDVLILGGGMANTFLLAQGKSVGKSLAEHDVVEDARALLAKAEKRGVQVVLPVDVIVAKEVTRGTEYKTLPAEKIPASWHIVDVGKQTLELIENALRDVRTVVWNGPIGVFEIPVFGAGTRHVARLLADKAQAGATVVVGGGDSVAAVQQEGLAGKMTHISTGGGASLEFLEGRELPGVAVLLDRPKPVPVEEPKPAPVAKAPPVPKATPEPATAAPARTAAASPTRAAARTSPAPARRAAAPPRPKPVMARKATPPTRKPAGTTRKAATPARKPAAAARRPPAPARKPAAPARRTAAARKPTKPTKPTRSTSARRPGSARKVTARPASTKTAARTKATAKSPARKPATIRKAAPAAKKSATPKKKVAAAKSPSKKSVTSKKPVASKKTVARKTGARKTASSKTAAATKKSKSTPVRPVAKRPAAKRPAVKRPAVKRPAVKRPAVKRPSPTRRNTRR